ncbi:MAG: hypothetical protein Q8M01_04895 [Rubrivivax sp.]|nr:hypothetical protein [Rubrivivax sp.]
MAQSSFKRDRFVQAIVFALATVAGQATAGIVTFGNVYPDPTGGVAGVLVIGDTAAGSVTVDGGSALTAERLVLGISSTGNGSLTVTGSGSSTRITFDSANANNIDVGGLGTGSLSVLSGASFVYGGTGQPCQLNCRIFVSNGAGSSGNLLVRGGGSSLSTVGGIVVGQASMFTQAADGGDYGTPGGASSGLARVDAGGRVNSSFLAVAAPGGGTARTGNESSVGTVIVDGIGSAWNLVRNAAQTGARALLSVATGRNTTGAVEVRNGATVRLDGTSAPGEFSGINIAAAGSGVVTLNQTGGLNVTGTGSRIDVEGGVGFMNIGRGIGGTGTLSITNGGVIAGAGAETGLVYATIGQGGGSGTVNINGAGSMLRLSGRNSTTNSDVTSVLGGGAFLAVGRGAAGVAGSGIVNVSNGGSLVVDTTPLALINPDGKTGMYVGAFNGSTGQMTVDGTGSRVLISAGSGLAPYIGIGSDAATGTLSIIGGGRVEVSSSHTSVPNPGSTGYLPGDALLFEVGRRNDGGAAGINSGTVNVIGTGSTLALTGNADALLIVGSGQGGVGTLNVTGGTVLGKAVLVGQEAGAFGTLNLSAGTLLIDGVLQGGPSAGVGAALSVGRGGGSGVANILFGSNVSITSTAAGAGLGAASSSLSPGGNGLINVTGGSTVTVSGPAARVAIGTQGAPTVAGTGTLNIFDGSTVAAQGAGATAQIGGSANSWGFVGVGAGASLSATSLIGVAHDGTVSTAGQGTLVVNGSVSSADLIVGENGLVLGNGTIHANVINYGVFNPGNSPGRLTIDGAFDNRGGTLLLEVLGLGGGAYAVDELVFTDIGSVLMGDGSVRFVFLDDTDPLDFLGSGDFALGSFFKVLAGNGSVVPIADSMLGMFSAVDFSAESAGYRITDVSFENDGAGSFAVSAVPVPATLALTLLGLALLAPTLTSHRRGAVQTSSPGRPRGFDLVAKQTSTV